MYQWKRERRAPSKPVGPSKKQLDALLAELRAMADEMYQYGNSWANSETTAYCVLAGAHEQVCRTIEGVRGALWATKSGQGTRERAARLARLADGLASGIRHTTNMLESGFYDTQRWYVNAPWYLYKAHQSGSVDGAREMLDKLATIGIVPKEREEEAA